MQTATQTDYARDIDPLFGERREKRVPPQLGLAGVHLEHALGQVPLEHRTEARPGGDVQPLATRQVVDPGWDPAVGVGAGSGFFTASSSGATISTAIGSAVTGSKPATRTGSRS